MILILRWVWIYIKVPDRLILVKKKYDKYKFQVSKCQQLEEDIQIKLPGIDENCHFNKLKNIYYELIPIVFLLAFYFIYGIILWSAGQEFKHARSDKVKFEKEYDQGVYFPLAWTSIISITLISVWYRKYEKENFVINKTLMILAVAAFLIIFIFSIIYSVSVLRDYSTGTRTMITSGFIAGSFAVFTCLMFFGYWSSNGYVFYKRHTFNIREYNEKHKENRKKTPRVNQNNVSQSNRRSHYRDEEEQKEGGSNEESK